jgi:hypothetical protein
VVVTCDRDFLDERRHPLIKCPAVFIFDFGSGTVDEMRRAFTCLAAVLRTPQFFDKWCTETPSNTNENSPLCVRRAIRSSQSCR